MQCLNGLITAPPRQAFVAPTQRPSPPKTLSSSDLQDVQPRIAYELIQGPLVSGVAPALHGCSMHVPFNCYSPSCNSRLMYALLTLPAGSLEHKGTRPGTTHSCARSWDIGQQAQHAVIRAPAGTYGPMCLGLVAHDART